MVPILYRARLADGYEAVWLSGSLEAREVTTSPAGARRGGLFTTIAAWAKALDRERAQTFAGDGRRPGT